MFVILPVSRGGGKRGRLSNGTRDSNLSSSVYDRLVYHRRHSNPIRVHRPPVPYGGMADNAHPLHVWYDEVDALSAASVSCREAWGAILRLREQARRLLPAHPMRSALRLLGLSLNALEGVLPSKILGRVQDSRASHPPAIAAHADVYDCDGSQIDSITSAVQGVVNSVLHAHLLPVCVASFVRLGCAVPPQEARMISAAPGRYLLRAWQALKETLANFAFLLCAGKDADGRECLSHTRTEAAYWLLRSYLSGDDFYRLILAVSASVQSTFQRETEEDRTRACILSSSTENARGRGLAAGSSSSSLDLAAMDTTATSSSSSSSSAFVSAAAAAVGGGDGHVVPWVAGVSSSSSPFATSTGYYSQPLSSSSGGAEEAMERPSTAEHVVAAAPERTMDCDSPLEDGQVIGAAPMVHSPAPLSPPSPPSSAAEEEDGGGEEDDIIIEDRDLHELVYWICEFVWYYAHPGDGPGDVIVPTFSYFAKYSERERVRVLHAMGVNRLRSDMPLCPRRLLSMERIEFLAYAEGAIYSLGSICIPPMDKPAVPAIYATLVSISHEIWGPHGGRAVVRMFPLSAWSPQELGRSEMFLVGECLNAALDCKRPCPDVSLDACVSGCCTVDPCGELQLREGFVDRPNDRITGNPFCPPPTYEAVAVPCQSSWHNPSVCLPGPVAYGPAQPLNFVWCKNQRCQRVFMRPPPEQLSGRNINEMARLLLYPQLTCASAEDAVFVSSMHRYATLRVAWTIDFVRQVYRGFLLLLVPQGTRVPTAPDNTRQDPSRVEEGAAERREREEKERNINEAVFRQEMTTRLGENRKPPFVGIPADQIHFPDIHFVLDYFCPMPLMMCAEACVRVRPYIFVSVLYYLTYGYLMDTYSVDRAMHKDESGLYRGVLQGQVTRLLCQLLPEDMLALARDLPPPYPLNLYRAIGSVIQACSVKLALLVGEVTPEDLLVFHDPSRHDRHMAGRIADAVYSIYRGANDPEGNTAVRLWVPRNPVDAMHRSAYPSTLSSIDPILHARKVLPRDTPDTECEPLASIFCTTTPLDVPPPPSPATRKRRRGGLP